MNLTFHSVFNFFFFLNNVSLYFFTEKQKQTYRRQSHITAWTDASGFIWVFFFFFTCQALNRQQLVLSFYLPRVSKCFTGKKEEKKQTPAQNRQSKDFQLLTFGDETTFLRSRSKYFYICLPFSVVVLFLRKMKKKKFNYWIQQTVCNTIYI